MLHRLPYQHFFNVKKFDWSFLLAVPHLTGCILSLFPQEYDDGYGTAYDDQGYESYDNNYSNQGQK